MVVNWVSNREFSRSRTNNNKLFLIKLRGIKIPILGIFIYTHYSANGGFFRLAPRGNQILLDSIDAKTIQKILPIDSTIKLLDEYSDLVVKFNILKKRTDEVEETIQSDIAYDVQEMEDNDFLDYMKTIDAERDAAVQVWVNKKSKFKISAIVTNDDESVVGSVELFYYNLATSNLYCTIKKIKKDGIYYKDSPKSQVNLPISELKELPDGELLQLIKEVNK